MTSKFSESLKKIFIKHKKKIFLNIKEKNYTFGYLNKMSNQICNCLLEKKINQNNRVIIAAKKDIIIFASIFACLKIGCSYSIIDFEMPKKRLQKIFKKYDPSLIIVNDKNEFLKINGKKKLLLNEIKIKRYKSKIKDFIVSDSLPAYIMFTSGSTGFPKGAIIARKSIINFVKTSKEKFLIKEGDIFTNVNPIYFDNSIFDIYASFFNGNKLVVFQNQDVKNASKLVKILFDKKCTSWFSTPSLLIYLLKLKLINKKNFFYVKRIIFGGEGFPKPQLIELIKLLGKKNFYNVYGPTEGTCICSSHLITKKDLTNNLNSYVTIGKIWKNFNFKIGNTNEKKIINTKGELIIYGPNISKGYIGDITQTKKVFTLNHKKNNKEKLLGYKTGDIVKNYGKNKNLYFVGRQDTQVKVMGYRIELNEIELSLNQINDVHEAMVFTSSINNLNNKIIAIISIKNKKLKKETIYNMLEKQLPYYMIPSNIYMVNNLIKNANNKIDRVKLKKIYEKKTFI
jgi:D-alanine--poly(phosphoribitol) ligase subunit 1